MKLLKFILYLLRYDIKCDENPEKTWKCTVRKKCQSHIFNPFFCLSCHKVTPYYIGFLKKKIKKQKMFTTYLQNKIKKWVFAKKLLRCFKTFKTKKVLKIFNFIFFCTVYIQDAPCDSRRKFHADRRIFKHY